MKYNWQQKDWPDFKYKLDEVEDSLLAIAEKVGHVTGILKALPDNTQTETIIDLMVSEAMKTSEIEGEFLNRHDVVSSIRKNLGLFANYEQVRDKRAIGIAKLMIDVRASYSEPLTKEKLFEWHTMLMEGSRGLTLGAWRNHEEPMQIVSGAMGKEKVYFEAPPSSIVPDEMNKFISWFNTTGPGGENEIKKPAVRSAIAHIYFETIHPFEDGNGRIGRAISEKALSQSLGRPVLLSLSRSIEKRKKEYYTALEEGQSSNEITSWINYFVPTVLQAQTESEALINFSLKKVKFFDRYKDKLNDRQVKVIRRMLEEGPQGFEGGMNARKYQGITKTSKATATRDLQDLIIKDALILVGGGRSTHYQIRLE